MPRADWGGSSSDLSGLFSGLLDQFESAVRGAASRQIARSKEEQAAEDSDTYDKWTNGLITDAEWLAYVANRVQETEGDPAEHQQWVEAYRKHSQAIEDSQLESQYKDGTLSIASLIAHYADRLNGLQPDSPEYRDLKSHYWDLIDNRDAALIEDQAQGILARINRGQAGYNELLNFYRSMLGTVRSSSPLYSQLKQNIQSIQDVVDGVSGGSGGSGGGSGGGSYGGLQGDAYQQANDAVVKLWTSGNVFVPGGPDVVRSVLDIYSGSLSDDTAVWNALAEDNVVIENMMQYAQDHPDAPYMLTPWGDQIPNTLENRQLLMNQGLRTYDYRIALGNASGRSVISVLNSRATFVDSTYGAQNAANASDYIQQVQQNTWERFELAGQNPDPTAALDEYATAGRVLERAAHRVLGEPMKTSRATESADQTGPPVTTTFFGSTQLFPEEQVDSAMQAQLRYAIEIGQFAQDSKNMTPEQMAHEASILFDRRPEGFWLSDAELQRVIGTNQTTSTPTGFGNEINVGTGMLGKGYAQRGLLAGSMVEQGYPTTEEPYRYVGIPGHNAPVAVPISQINGILGTTDYQDGSTIGGFEKVNGKTIWVVRPLEDVPAPKWYVNGQGKWLTSKDYANFGRSAQAIANAGFTLQEVPGLTGWKKVTSGDNTFYRDPEDGHLYLGAPPFRAGISTAAGQLNYGDFVDSGGNIDLTNNRLAASTAKGYVAFWGDGVSRRDVQSGVENIINNPLDDRINTDFFHERDDKNNVSIDPLDPAEVSGMFWTSADAHAAGVGRGRFDQAANQRRAEQNRVELMDREEMRRKAKVNQWIETKIGNAAAQVQFNKMNPDLTAQQAGDQAIRATAKTVGVSFGTEVMRPKAQPSPLPQARPELSRGHPVLPTPSIKFTPPKVKEPVAKVKTPPAVIRPVNLPLATAGKKAKGILK